MCRRSIRTMALPVCVCVNMVCQLVPALSLLFTEARMDWKASPTILIYQLDKYVPVPLQALSRILSPLHVSFTVFGCAITENK